MIFTDFRRFSSTFADFRRSSLIFVETRLALGSIWGHLGVTLGSFLAYGRTLEPYLRQFDVEKHEMASVMGICAGLVGPKTGNVEKQLVLQAFLKGSEGPRVIQNRLQGDEPDRLGGVGRG